MKAVADNAKRLAKVDRAAIVDEYGELRRKLALGKRDADRAKELGEQIASWFDGQAGDQEFQVEGRRYLAQVSARPLKRSVKDMVKLFLAIGKQAFLAACDFPAAAMDRLLDAEQQTRLIHSEHVGKRRVTAVPKAAAAKVA
jgi:hypothetical protein